MPDYFDTECLAVILNGGAFMRSISNWTRLRMIECGSYKTDVVKEIKKQRQMATVEEAFSFLTWSSDGHHMWLYPWMNEQYYQSKCDEPRITMMREAVGNMFFHEILKLEEKCFLGVFVCDT